MQYKKNLEYETEGFSQKRFVPEKCQCHYSIYSYDRAAICSPRLQGSRDNKAHVICHVALWIFSRL